VLLAIITLRQFSVASRSLCPATESQRAWLIRIWCQSFLFPRIAFHACVHLDLASRQPSLLFDALEKSFCKTVSEFSEGLYNQGWEDSLLHFGEGPFPRETASICGVLLRWFLWRSHLLRDLFLIYQRLERPMPTHCNWNGCHRGGLPGKKQLLCERHVRVDLLFQKHLWRVHLNGTFVFAGDLQHQKRSRLDIRRGGSWDWVGGARGQGSQLERWGHQESIWS
jgi:hypothetical protein